MKSGHFDTRAVGLPADDSVAFHAGKAFALQAADFRLPYPVTAVYPFGAEHNIVDPKALAIVEDPQTGLGKWSVEEIVQHLKTGQTRTTMASGPMAEGSTSKMSNADLRFAFEATPTIPYTRWNPDHQRRSACRTRRRSSTIKARERRMNDLYLTSDADQGPRGLTRG
jgi:hypothetical protein